MSPYEKALELFKKFYGKPNNSKNRIKNIEFDTAKQCALIVVDEIIRIAPSYGIIEWTIDEDTKEYFELVKKEIEKF
jgi:hypothetical protein